MNNYISSKFQPSLSFVLSFCVLLLLHGNTVAQTYYVSTTGNDNNPGTIDAPFKTLEAARNHGKSASGSSVTIYLRGGEYFLSTTFPLSNTNFDPTKKLLITNYNNEAVTIAGGHKLDNSLISLVKDPAILSRLPAEAAYKLYVTDLKAQQVTDPGQLQQTGYGHNSAPAPAELFIGDQAFQLARAPNSGKIPIGQVISPGTLVGDPVHSGAKFQFSYAPASHWAAANAKDLWVSGILNMGWSDETVPVASLSGGNTVSLGALTVYGVQSNTSSASNNVKDRLAIRGFNFFNILDALDTAGEYYIDRTNDLLYFWPSAASIASSEIVVSTLTLSLISITNLSNVTINGIKFAYTRGSAIEGSGASHITISNSTFCNLGQNGVTTNNCTYFLINKCKFFNIGATAIGLLGGNRTTLASSGNIVENSEFYNDGRIWHSFNPPITLNGVGSTVSNCYFHDLAGQAILYQGNNHLIVNNHFNNVCTGFSDIGAVGTGRDPSSTGTTIQNNFFENITCSPDVLITAIYIDDGSGGIKVHSNLFLNCGTGGSQAPPHGIGAVHINGGADNDFQNNIFINSQMAISGIQWDQQTWKTYLTSATIKTATTQVVNILSPVYLQQYPFLKNFFDPTRQRSNLIHNTIAINVGTFSNSALNVVSNMFADANPSLQSANNFTSIVNYFKNTGLPTEPRAWLGFTPINFNAIGIPAN